MTCTDINDTHVAMLHYSDIIMSAMASQSPASRWCTKPFVQAQIKENINVRGIPRSSVNSPHKGQWRGVMIFSLICAWINGWVTNGEAGDLRRHRAHYDVTLMSTGTGAIGRLPDASEATLINMGGIINSQGDHQK